MNAPFFTFLGTLALIVALILLLLNLLIGGLTVAVWIAFLVMIAAYIVSAIFEPDVS